MHKCAQLRSALEASLDILGEPSKNALLSYLTRNSGISLQDSGCSSVEEIEGALSRMLGEGAALIMKEFRRELAAAPTHARQGERVKP